MIAAVGAAPLAIPEPALVLAEPLLMLPAHRLVLLEPPSHRQIPAQLLLARTAAHRPVLVSFTAAFTAESIAAAATFQAARFARAALDALHGFAAPTGLSPGEGALLRGASTFAALPHALSLRLNTTQTFALLSRLALTHLATAPFIAAALAIASFAARPFATLPITAAVASVSSFTLAPPIALGRAIAGGIAAARLSQRQRARADHDEQSQYLRRSTHK